MRLRGRLLIAFSYLLILTVAALAVPLAITIRRGAHAQLEGLAGAQALVIASSLSDAFTLPDPAAALPPLIEQYGRDTGARVIVTDARGLLLADSAGVPPTAPAAVAGEVSRALTGERVRLVQRATDGQEDLLVMATPVLRDARVVGAVRLALPTADVDARVSRSWAALAAVGVVVLALGLAVAWYLASSLTRPLRSLSVTAARLGRGDTTARTVPAGARDVAEVGEALNRMATDVEAMLAQQGDFVSNASHQLRTPLSGMRLRLEAIVAQGGPAAGEARAALVEVDRLGRLVHDLLLLATSNRPAPAGSATDLDAAVRAAVDRWAPQARDRGQLLTLEVPEHRAPVAADASDLAMVLDNLIDNAVRYCPPGSRLTVTVGDRQGRPTLNVEDDGPGIAADDRPRVFERFYRGRAGRRAPPGTGLGLPIVRELARRWGGAVELRSRGPGTVVVVTFPPLSTSAEGRHRQAVVRGQRPRSG